MSILQSDLEEIIKIISSISFNKRLTLITSVNVDKMI